MRDVRLNPEEQAMLSGAEGPAVQRALEIVLALGKIYGAEGLVPIESAQISGVSYKNLGDAGLEFLRQWAAEGARVHVPATLNPAGMDLSDWETLGFSKDFAEKQIAVIETFSTMGVRCTCTCTPYLVGNVPKPGAHVAWSESSAVCFANSVLGARTNREGGPSALAAAITGRTARYGYHLERNRQADYVIEVDCAVESEADFGALGYLVGRLVGAGVPYFRDLNVPDVSDLAGDPVRAIDALVAGEESGLDRLMALGAAMAASGAVALYHVEGVTPEAQPEIIRSDARVVRVSSLSEGYAALNGPLDQIDFVHIGCPHATLATLHRIADSLTGQRVRATLWITTARETKEEAQQRGYVATIENAGGKVVADTCPIVAPVAELGFQSLATNSAKTAFYAPSQLGLNVRFGPLEKCIAAALTGQWRGTGRRL